MLFLSSPFAELSRAGTVLEGPVVTVWCAVGSMSLNEGQRFLKDSKK